MAAIGSSVARRAATVAGLPEKRLMKKLTMVRVAALALSGTLACLPHPAHAQQCTAGDPCGIGDTVSQGGVNGNTGAGNPIDVTSGNKYQVAVDVPGEGDLSLSFRRHYNSANNAKHSLGPGWTHSFDTRLQRAEKRGDATSTTIQITQADGRILHFVPDVASHDGARRYLSRPAGYGVIEESVADIASLRKQLAGTPGPRSDPGSLSPWTWRWLDGRRVSFDGLGRPRIVRDAGGARLEVEFDRAGRLSQLRGSAGKLLRFTYWDDGAERLQVFGTDRATQLTGPAGSLRSVVMSAGPEIRYGYDDSGRLDEVRLPDGSATKYEYESGGTRLTRIVGPDKKILGEYGYDIAGRAVRTRDENGAPLRFEYLASVGRLSETRLHHADGKVTHYRWMPAIGTADSRIVESTGAGCRDCAATNTRYEYGADGRVIARLPLDATGKPGVAEEFRYDARGRLWMVHARAVNGERLLLRKFEYDDAAGHDFPVRVRRPSVARGLQSMLSMAYAHDASGGYQLVGITESGYVPQPDRPLRFVARRTTYEYETHDGRSRLQRIDGPLPNGRTATPSDSDIIEFEYAANGSLTARVSPGGERVSAPEAAAVPAVANATFQTAPVGVVRAAVDTWSRPTHYRGLALGFGNAGSVAQNEVLAAATQTRAVARLIDDFGRVVAIRNPDQGWQIATHDEADRLVRVVDARGAATSLRYDAAGRLERLSRSGLSRAYDEVVHFEWSGSRLARTRVVDADGERVDRYNYAATGALERHELRIARKSHEVTLAQEFEWSAAGELRAIRMPSGERAEYQLPSSPEELRVVTASLSGGLSTEDDASLELAVPVQRASYVTDAALGATPVGADEADEAGAAAAAELDDVLARRFAAGAARVDIATLDAAGLPREMRTHRGHFSLAWDVAARLREVRDAATKRLVARYGYDARGRRVQKRTFDAQGGESTQFFFYDGTRLVAVTDEEGRVTDEFVHNGLTPIAWRRFERAPANRFAALVSSRSRHSELFALETDERGALLRVVAAGKASAADPVVHSLRLDVFGEETRGYVAGEFDPRLRMIGQYADDETGLYYQVARFYDPASRRFISPDPAGVSDSFGFDASLLLDTTIFAGARPDVYVDPDGAARITYYAVLDRTGTGANARLTVNNRGFNTARWAFVIEDIQAGGDASVLGQLRNQYAANGTQLLFERGGNFINGTRGGTLSADGRSLSWNGASTLVTDFLNHYDTTNQLVSVPQFTIDNVDDDNATRLLQFLTQTAVQRVACTDDPAPWMPPIPFATEETSITPATADAAARPQRLLACGAGSTAATAAGLEQRRIRRYEAAAEINETGRMGNQCANGCPGIKYYCTAVRCLARNTPPATGTFYVPSYGRSQFTLATLVGELINNWNSFSATDRTFLGLGNVTLADLQAAQTRGNNAGTHFDGVTAVTAAGTNATAWQAMTPAQQQAWLTANTPLTEADYENYLEAAGTWDALSAAARTTFTTNTGLGEQEYEDMVRMRTVPIRNSNGLNLTNDARAGIVTQAIYSNAALQTALHGIFTNYDRFTVMSEALMLANLTAAIGAYPNATEEENAARVARAHNGGNWRRTLTQLTTNDFANYVKRFIGSTGYRNEGYVSAMRCVEDFGTRVDNVVRPATGVTSTNGVGVLGVEVALLVLR